MIESDSGKRTSMYTDLIGGACTMQRETDVASSERRCRGALGYQLIVTTFDDRDSITVVAPNRQEFHLNLPNLICNASFGSVGQKAEWRVVQKEGSSTPIALIVRVNCQRSGKITSYLSVSKITQDEVCVTDRIGAAADANVRARAAADSSAGKRCLANQ